MKPADFFQCKIRLRMYATLTFHAIFSRSFCHLPYVQASMSNIVIGSHVWVEDKDLAWVDGEVFKIDGQNAHIRTNKGKTVCVTMLLTSICPLFL